MSICINCGAPATELHHVVPLSLGGNDIESNRVWLCSLCHSTIHGFNRQTRGIEWKRLQAEGIAIAKAEGKYKGRKPKDIDTDKFKKACKEWRAGERTAVSIQKQFSISAQTFYRWINPGGRFYDKND